MTMIANAPAGTVAPTTGPNAVVPAGEAGTLEPQGASRGAMATAGGTSAADAAWHALVRTAVMWEQIRRALDILKEVGADIQREVTVQGEVAASLQASLGEATSLEDQRVLSRMLQGVVDELGPLVARAKDANESGARANLQVRIAAEGVYATGAEGGYVDRRFGAGR